MENNFMDQYFQDFKALKLNDDVTGVVSILKDDYIIIDLGSAVEGKMYINEYTNEKNKKFQDFLQVGERVQGRVMKIVEEGTAIAYLSRRHLIMEENFLLIKQAFASKKNIMAKVVRLVNKGVILSSNNVELFMHESQTGTDNPESLLGQEIEVEIVNLDSRNRKVSVSRSQVIYKEERARKNKEYQDLLERRTNEAEAIKVNDELEMKVIEIQPTYAILEYGLNTAILPASQLDHIPNYKVSDILTVGDTVKVKVLLNDVINKRRKISVSRKALLETPYQIYKKVNPLSSVVEGKIIKKLYFGSVVELAPGVTSLLHNSELSYNPNDNTDATLVIGQNVTAKIIQYHDKDEKISLSIKQLGTNPWATVEVSRGQIVEATVKEISQLKGITCLVQGVDAYLPIQEVANVDRVSRVEDYVNVGDVVLAKVVDVDHAKWYIKLSIKEKIQDEERKEFDKYYETQKETVVTLGDLFADRLNDLKKK